MYTYSNKQFFLFFYFYTISYSFSRTRIPNFENWQTQLDDSVMVESGQMTLEVDKLTILINSTYEIIQDIDLNSTTHKTSEPNTTYRKVAHRFRKYGSSTPMCRKFSVSEKYALLEKAGGRNQLYMADSPDEAARNFAILYPQDSERALFDDVERGSNPTTCDQRCNNIQKHLLDAINNRNNMKKKSEINEINIPLLLNDTGPMEIDEGLKTFSRSCSLETFVPIGNCTIPGEEVSWAHEQLCSVCRGIYMLSENCFPSFFNAVHCNKMDTGCIFDTFSDRAHGRCHTDTLSLRVLRNQGGDCEDWSIEQIQLPVACQCLLSKTSWLRSNPPKEF